MSSAPLYRTAIDPAWIDYNNHLRDAYYGLIVSFAADALMDRIGLHAGYRQRTGNTLFTLELHMHFLHEVKGNETVEVWVRILGTDSKRIHAAFDLRCAGKPQVVATAETLLLHVHQGPPAAAAPFAPEIRAQLTALVETEGRGATDAGEAPAAPPGSRRIELRSPT